MEKSCQVVLLEPGVKFVNILAPKIVTTTLAVLTTALAFHACQLTGETLVSTLAQ